MLQTDISKVQPTRFNVFSIYLFLSITLHVSGGSSAHHQEHKIVHTASCIVKPILLISVNCSTCFRRFLRPSSGAQNCTYSVRYCQTNTAACCNTWRCMYSFVLLMMGGGTAWNM